MFQIDDRSSILSKRQNHATFNVIKFPKVIIESLCFITHFYINNEKKMTKVQKTAFLVTGSNRGYGEAISRHILSELSDSTCHVVLHARSGQVQWLESRGVGTKIYS